MQPWMQEDENVQDPAQEERQKVINDYLVNKYNKAADSSGVKQAEDMKAYGDIGSTFGKLAEDYGNASQPQGVYLNKFSKIGDVPQATKKFEGHADWDGVAKAGASLVAGAENKRKESINNFLTQDKLEGEQRSRDWEDKTHTRQQGEWDRADKIRNDEDNVGSETSKTYQALAKKMMPSKDFSGMSATQLKQGIPALEKLYQIDQNALARRDMMALKREQADKEKAPNADQKKVAGFGKRLEQAESDFSELEHSGYNRADASSGLGAHMPNILKSKEAQRQDQAERNFINAVLRRESGAAISPSEFSNAEVQYFPRAGDAPEVIEQKRRNRQQVIENFKAEAGSRAYNAVPTITPSNHTPKADTVIDNYAKQHNLSYEGAKSILVNRGYKPNE